MSLLYRFSSINELQSMGPGTALCIQPVNGTNELKYAAYGRSLFHLMFPFYAFSDADGIDAKPKFIRMTLHFVEG